MTRSRFLKLQPVARARAANGLGGGGERHGGVFHFLRLALVGLSLTHSLAWLLMFNTTRRACFVTPGSAAPLRLQALARAHLTPLREHRGEETGDDVAPRR